MSVTAYIALGSNLGDKRSFLDRALQALRETPGITVKNVSLYIETDPVGGPEEFSRRQRLKQIRADCGEHQPRGSAKEPQHDALGQ